MTLKSTGRMNHVREPEPEVPPRLHIEFQKGSSAGEPSRALAYSVLILSRSGRSAASHCLPQSGAQRSLTRASAFARRSRQSSGVP